jgi:hypothetical protein
VLTLRDVFFRYDRAQDLIEGGGQMSFPPAGGVGAEVAIKDGALNRLAVNVIFPEPGIVVAPAVFLNEVNGGLQFKPLILRGGAVFTAGGSYAGVRLLAIRGGILLNLDNGSVRVDGSVSVLGYDLAEAFFEAGLDGYVGFGGKLHFDYSAFSVEAGLAARFATDGRWQADLNARLCIGDFACASGQAVISSVGMAGCISVNIDLLFDEIELAAGAGYRWGDSSPDFFFSCNLSDYKAFASGARASQLSQSFTVKRGTKLQAIAFTGRGAPPDVTLHGPDGTVIVVPKQGMLRQRGRIAYHVDQVDTTFVQIAKPAPGRWTVELQPGSAPIARAQLATGLRPPKVTAAVRGRGRAKRLVYDIQGVPAGETVTFYEKGAKAGARLGRARGRHGVLAFRPSPGPAGTRTIAATISRHGLAVRTIPVARYRAPATERLSAPRHVRVTRLGRSTLVVTWTGVRGAGGYVVGARLSDGRRAAVRATRRRAVLTGISPRARGLVSVRAVARRGRLGFAGTARVARARAIRKVGR